MNLFKYIYANSLHYIKNILIFTLGCICIVFASIAVKINDGNNIKCIQQMSSHTTESRIINETTVINERQDTMLLALNEIFDCSYKLYIIIL